MKTQVNIFNQPHRKIIEPGGLYFGENEDVIYTLLGSCVAVTLWHPVKKLAGMCHAILPNADKNKDHNRYADCAIRKFIREIRRVNTLASDYEVGVYGGGNMFPHIAPNKQIEIGNRNVDEVVKLLKNNNFNIKFKDVGGETARKLTLYRETGEIGLKHVTTNEN